MRRKYLLLPMAMTLALSLSSCSLLPEEEQMRTAPLIHEFQQEEYEQAQVTRGDLVETAGVSARYVPVKKESLLFPLTGIPMDKMYVQAGDAVQAGQLLGQQKVDAIEESLEKAQLEETSIRLQLEHLEKSRQLALRRHEIETAETDRDTAREALDKLEETFAQQRQSLEDALSICRLSIETYENQLKERRLYAPFDGTVTFVRNYEDGHICGYAEVAVTLADSTMTLFRAETQHWASFHEGDRYEIEVSRTPYALEVISEEALNLEPQEKKEGKKAYVYFKLLEPGAALEEGDYGTLEVELDRRENVLHIPAEAVLTAGDMTIVYYQREDGLKAYKEIEAGVTINRRTEILSGLEEGEWIIAG